MSRTSRNIPEFVIGNMSCLRSSRVIAGLTRLDLAVKSGIHTRSISKYELCVQFPSKENYNKLAEILGWQKWK